MAALPAISAEVWVPPTTSTGQALANAWPNLVGGSTTSTGAGSQYDPNYVRGYNIQTVMETGSAGAPTTDD